MKNKKSAKKRNQAPTECSKCSESDHLRDRVKYLEMFGQRIVINEEFLDRSSKQLKERREQLIENSNVKLQLVEEIRDLKINLDELKIAEKLNIEDKNSSTSEKLNEMIQQNISLTKEVVCLQDRVEKEHRQRTKFNESWKSSIGELLVEHNENVFSIAYEIK